MSTNSFIRSWIPLMNGSYKTTTRKFSDSDLYIDQTLRDRGWPANVRQLIAMLPPERVQTKYSVSLKGDSGYQACTNDMQLRCKCSYYAPNGTQVASPAIILGRSDHGDAVKGDGTQWITILNTPAALFQLDVYADCDGSDSRGDCGCANDPNYQNVVINLKLEVLVDLVGWCTTTGQDNMAQEMCYDYMADYIYATGANQNVSAYLRDYCGRRYGDKSLSIFNDPCSLPANDCQVCACNMPQQNYDAFLSSLQNDVLVNETSIPQNCLFPACSISPYKPNNLEGCPAVNCLNNINVNDTNVIEGSINITADASCTNVYTIPPEGTSTTTTTTVPTGGSTGGTGSGTGGASGNSVNSGGTNNTTVKVTPTGTTTTETSDPDPDPDPADVDASTSAWVWVILIAIVFLVIAVVIVVVIVVVRKQKAAKIQATPMMVR